MEEVTISFQDNGDYRINSKLLFDPPQYNRRMMHHIYNANLALLEKIAKGLALDSREEKDLENLPSTLMLCFLNGFTEAKHRLADAKPLLKAYPNQKRGGLVWTPIEETLTMWPAFFSRMCGSTPMISLIVPR